VRPEWTLQGERVVVRMHVNTAVAAGRGDHFMVDIDPVPTANITGTSRLRDTDAAALFHSNVAMQALAELQIEDAWVHSVRALQLSPGMPNLWVNLGAIYRYAGQHDVAERNYLHALQLDPTNDSAMNNLVVLYRMDGRLEELAYWDARVARYRDANPYYHAWRGDQAARDEDWQGARDHYQRALQLAPDDARLLYALGLAHLGLNEPAIATGYLQSAIAHAVLRSDIDLYAARLRELEQASALSASDAAAES
jgi:Flp pilus assembly protein TadD